MPLCGYMEKTVKNFKIKKGVYIPNIVKSQVSFKACISVGHIFTIPTSGNILMHLHRLLFHTTSYSDLHYWSYCNHFISSKPTQFSGNNVSIVLRIVRYSRQVRQIGRRERQNAGNVLAIFHMVSHIYMEEWLALSAVQSVLSSQPFHSSFSLHRMLAPFFHCITVYMQTTTTIPQYSDSIMYKHLADV